MRSGKKTSTSAKIVGDNQLLLTLLNQVENKKKPRNAIRDFNGNLRKIKNSNLIISYKSQNSTFLETVLTAAYDNDDYEYLDATLTYFKEKGLEIDKACSRPVLIELFNLHPKGHSIIEEEFLSVQDKQKKEAQGKIIKKPKAMLHTNAKEESKSAKKMLIIFPKLIAHGATIQYHGLLVYMAATIGPELLKMLLDNKSLLENFARTAKESYSRLQIMKALNMLAKWYIVEAKAKLGVSGNTLNDSDEICSALLEYYSLGSLLGKKSGHSKKPHKDLREKLRETEFLVLDENLKKLLRINTILIAIDLPSSFKSLYALNNRYVNSMIKNHLEQSDYPSDHLIALTYDVIDLNLPSIDHLLTLVQKKAAESSKLILLYFIRGNYDEGSRLINANINWYQLIDYCRNTALHHLYWQWSQCQQGEIRKKIEETVEKLYNAGGYVRRENMFGKTATQYLPDRNVIPKIFNDYENECNQLLRITDFMHKMTASEADMLSFNKELMQLANKEALLSKKIIDGYWSTMDVAISSACQLGLMQYLDQLLKILQENNVDISSYAESLFRKAFDCLDKALHHWDGQPISEEKARLTEDNVFLTVNRLMQYGLTLNLDWTCDLTADNCVHALIVSPYLVGKFLDMPESDNFHHKITGGDEVSEMNALHYLIIQIERQTKFQQALLRKDYQLESAQNCLLDDLMIHTFSVTAENEISSSQTNNEDKASSSQPQKSQVEWEDYCDLFKRFLQFEALLAAENISDNVSPIVMLLALNNKKMNDIFIDHLKNEEKVSVELLFQVTNAVKTLSYETANDIVAIAEKRMVTVQQKSQLLMIKILRFDYSGALKLSDQGDNFPPSQCEKNFSVALQHLTEKLAQDESLITCDEEKIQLVKWLVKQGVNLFHRDSKDLELPIQNMLFMENEIITPLAIQYCRDEDPTSAEWGVFLDSMLHLSSAVIDDIYQIFQHKWEKTNDKKYLHQLLGFAIRCKPDGVTDILNLGAEINNVDLGNSFLCLALQQDNLLLPQLLLDGGADPNLGTPDGYTPLCKTILSENMEALQLLASSKYYRLDVKKPIKSTIDPQRLASPFAVATQYKLEKVCAWLIEQDPTILVEQNELPQVSVTLPADIIDKKKMDSMPQPQQKALASKSSMKKQASEMFARLLPKQKLKVTSAATTVKPPTVMPRMKRAMSMRLLRERRGSTMLAAVEGNTLCQLLQQSRDETSFQAALKELGKIELTTDSKQLSQAVESFITFAIAQQKSATILWFCRYINGQMQEQSEEESETAYTQDQFISLLNAAIRCLLVVDRELVRQLQAMLVEVQQAVRTVQLKKWQATATPFLPNESRPQTGRKFLAESIGTTGANLVFKKLRRERRLSSPTVWHPRFDLFPCVEKIKQAASFLGGDLVYDKDTPQFKEINGIPNCYLFIPGDFPKRFYERRAIFDEWHIKQLDGKGARTLCYKTQQGKFIVYEDRPITHELKIRGEERLLLCQIPGEAGSSLYVAVEYCENGLHTTHDVQRLCKSGKSLIDLTDNVTRYLREEVAAKKTLV